MISSFIGATGLFLETLSLHDLYFQWQTTGIFDFLLPTILIFAVVFGILTSTNILGGQRGVNFIIAAAVALLAMQYPFISEFFSLIFPNLGVGLAILLVVLIMVGLFIGDENRRQWGDILGYGGLGVGAIVAIVTLNQLDWFGSVWWIENWVSALWILILVLVIAPLVIPRSDPSKKDKPLTLGPMRS